MVVLPSLLEVVLSGGQVMLAGEEVLGAVEDEEEVDEEVCPSVVGDEELWVWELVAVAAVVMLVVVVASLVM